MHVIDSDNYSASGIEALFFPGGEPHIKLPKDLPTDLVCWLKLRKWNDVGLAACLLDTLAQLQAERLDALDVFIPYFPGGRQDRSDGLTPKTLDIMGLLLCADIVRPTVFDAHSNATLGWALGLDLCDLEFPTKKDVVGIIAPDTGAINRAHSFQMVFYPQAHFLACTKERDFTTGRLSHYQMPALKGSGRYLVVDDICDGGGTFNLLADAFRKDPLSKSSKLELIVSHGIFSKGLDAIDPIYEAITTTDSWCTNNSYTNWAANSGDRLTILPLLPLFLKHIGATQDA